ncbi:hypothetical protein MF271_07315 [Deinococcus sp. KNUC1210]|uniref:hypothetical protein n=1 Tax=Deinococcus sp. KNUC1210 TaxID=2917691 RepID=UPI001EEF891E|nr:hypothetical protein [Deinococcus sp. KNUC1210]ULH16389.1 hypothetical protein MF271_07315 [Deinococcus sp. KNUC1210]
MSDDQQTQMDTVDTDSQQVENEQLGMQASAEASQQAPEELQNVISELSSGPLDEDSAMDAEELEDGDESFVDADELFTVLAKLQSMLEDQGKEIRGLRREMRELRESQGAVAAPAAPQSGFRPREDRPERSFSRDDRGGSDRGPREGGYRGNREGGQGGYQGNRDGGSREGGFRPREDRGGSREGGFRPREDRGASQGGYQGNREGGQGGYRGNREGGQGGYQGNRDSGSREGGFRPAKTGSAATTPVAATAASVRPRRVANSAPAPAPTVAGAVATAATDPRRSRPVAGGSQQ